jgi:hypothetical protein
MSPSLRNISKRTAEKARGAAEGSPVPAGQEPPSGETAATPVTAERGSMRKRVRRLGRMREVLLRELGALVVEMKRLGRDNPELVSRKADELVAIDEELRGLREALGERQTVEQVVVAGVAGSCARCGTLMATDDRFCASCGLAVVEPAAAGEAEPAGAGGAEPAGAGVAGAAGAEPVATVEPAAASEAEPAIAVPPPVTPETPRGAEAVPPPPAPVAAQALTPPPPPPAPEPPPPAPEAPARQHAQDELTATAPPKP